MTYEEIGQVIGISSERVRQAESSALKKISDIIHDNKSLHSNLNDLWDDIRLADNDGYELLQLDNFDSGNFNYESPGENLKQLLIA